MRHIGPLLQIGSRDPVAPSRR